VLREALVAMKADAEKSDRDKQRVRRSLEDWNRTPEFAALRTTPVLARLPSKVQVAWIALWADADALLAECRAD